MRKIGAIISDLHIGHTLGLCNPNSTVSSDADGKLKQVPVKINDFQHFLWKHYLHFVETVKKVAGKDEVFVLCMGDLTQGKQYVRELMSTRMSDQITLAVDALTPLLKLPNVRLVRLIKGTGVHVFEEGSSEILVAERLHSDHPKLDIQPLYHGLLDVGGCKIDYSHHGTTGGTRAWLTGNECRYYLRSLMISHVERGRKPPELVLRGHYHRRVKETLTFWKTDGTDDIEYQSTLLLIPSFCGLDEHARKATKSPDTIVIGGAIATIEDGELMKTQLVSRTLDIRTEETL